MFKKTLSMIMVLAMILSLGTTALAVDKSEISISQISAIGSVHVDGVRLDTKTDDNIGYFWVDTAGRTQSPVRLLVEAMGYDITYKDSVVTIPGGPNGDVVITIGSDELKVGGSVVKMDTIAYTINNRTYIPLRFVAEALNATVDTGGYGQNGFWIKITTTFRPERTINGVATKPFTQCTNVQKFIEANKDLFTFSNADRLTMEYTTADYLQLKLDIFETGNGYSIQGLDAGGPQGEKQYELVYALIDDVVEETSRQAVKDMLAERNKMLALGWTEKGGIGADAKVWRDAHDNQTVRVGNVNVKWSDYMFSIKLSTAS